MWRLQQCLRVIAIWAMVLPFLGTSLVAKGVMPGAAPNGTVSFVICANGLMVEMAFDPVTMQPVDDDGGTVDGAADACAWAALHGVASLPDPDAAPRPDLTLTATAAPEHDTLLRVAQATGLPPSTGPPALF